MSTSRDPYKYFRIEARELVQDLEKGALEIEKGLSAAEVVPKLLRLAHTLKGAARVVKQDKIAELAHAAEDQLVPFRDQAGAAPHELGNALLGLFDSIAGHLNALDQPQPVANVNESLPLARNPAEDMQRTVRVDAEEMDALLRGMLESGAQFEQLRQLRGDLERTRNIADILVEQMSGPQFRQLAGQGDANFLIKTRSLAEELRREINSAEQRFVTGANQLDRELRQVRQAAEHLRLLAVSTLFPSLERTARDAAHAVGKQVRLETQGGSTRIDAHVLDTVQSALVQLVRNAVAHGIESVADRAAAGKPPVGLIKLDVIRRGGRIAFRCQDDGRGIDLEAVRTAALRNGLSAELIRGTTEQDLIELLLRGGLTTAEDVSEIAGRGVGLDVVREVAARLGAEVTLHTKIGQGTTFEILVPASLASLDVLMVEEGGITAAIPFDAVRRTLHIRPDELVTTHRSKSVVFNGEAIPVVPLTQILGKRQLAQPAATAFPAIVLGVEPALMALGVDRILSVTNVVLRPLPSLSPANPIVAGLVLDSAGVPQIVLDAVELVAVAYGSAQDDPGAGESAALPILVVDDSLTTRMLEQSILESAGYHVDLAVSGEDAMEKAQMRQYGLFLVDVEMPGMDGFTFVERTRKDPVLGLVPAILVTSLNSPDDLRKGKAAGAVAHIVKSEFNQVELLKIIEKLIGKAH